MKRNQNLKVVFAMIAAVLILGMILLIGIQRSTIIRLERQFDSISADANYYHKLAIDCVTRGIRIQIPEPGREP